MCKKSGNAHCSELGTDPALWSKDAPLAKPQYVKEELQIFSDSVNLVQAGNVSEAKSLLKNSKDFEMREWFHVHAQNSGGWRNRVLGIPAPQPTLPLDPVKTFAKFEATVFARDNFTCRYCSLEVLPKKVFKNMHSTVGSDFLPLGLTNATRSGFYLMFVATLDHVYPWSLGGRTNESNLVTCCWSCNYGKSNFTVAQLGMTDPLRQ